MGERDQEERCAGINLYLSLSPVSGERAG